MLRNVRAPLAAVTRIHRLSTPPTIRAASTVTVSDNASSLTPRALPRKIGHAGKPWKGKGKGKEREGEGEGESKPKRPLMPHELSKRLLKLCEEGKLDEAVDTLKNMPLDAQNTSVWNTMIHQAGRAGRFQLAYQLYIDMKRRGLKPTVRTFTTLMGGFTRVPSWAGCSKLLDNVHKTYESFLQYADLLKDCDPASVERGITPIVPINAYITILGRAGQYQRMFDVYNALDASGPLAPTSVTYTAVLHALGQRSMAARGDSPAARTTCEQTASDARLVWRQLAKRIEDGALKIDAYPIANLLHSLARGRPADQVAAFDVLREYVGLAKPGETAPAPKVEINGALLADVLWLCNVTKKHRLCVHFVQQLMDADSDILDHGHMDHVLAAYGSLAATGSTTEAARALQTLEWMLERELTSDRGQRIRPGLSTYTLVLVACWRAKDWENTMRTFELMTGYHAVDFADGATDTPQQTLRSQGKNILPDAAATSCIARTAVATGDAAAMRQCLRIVHRLSLTKYLSVAEGADAVETRGASQFKKDATYYARQMAFALVNAVGVVVPKESPSPEERDFLAIRREARTLLSAQRHQRPNGTPVLEEQLLGSEQSLSDMDDKVHWERIYREQKASSRSF